MQVNEQQNYNRYCFSKKKKNYNRYIRKKVKVVKPEARYCTSSAILPKPNIDREM